MVLLESTMRTSKVYADLFALLAQHKYGIRKREACDRLGYSSSQFDMAADEAMKCGYVREYRNLGKPHHPKFIQLVDPFILFHYHFLDPVQGDAPLHWSDFVADQGRYSNWRGAAFEMVCLYHVRQLKTALGIEGIKTKEDPWSSSPGKTGAHIDLDIERADRVTNLCEMKFTDGPYELSEANARKLIEKAESFREETGTRHALKTVLVSASGITGGHDGAIAKKIGIDDLFS
ncbi:MAG: hypothetical protein IJ131_08750 [Eggerthellaceae bacterium]|nr:hypothetical protein [Eggerthellaceae bacterium]